MSQGPIIVVSSMKEPPFASALHDAELFPVISSNWLDAKRAVAQLTPAAVLVASSEADESNFEALAKQVGAAETYLPLIAVDPTTSLPDNAIPCTQRGNNFDRLIARLRSALRVRTLHSTVMRRIENTAASPAFDDADPAREPTVLLIGRGASYPSLSVSLGERMGVVGALSIEAAAKHLSTRDIDGIVLGEGFTSRVEDAFLTVMAEDARFRNLPVLVTSDAAMPAHDLPNLEVITADPSRVAASAFPLIRQHAFESHLRRMLKSIEAGGLLDPRTGLLAPPAFDRDFTNAVHQTLSHGGGLSVARFAFDPNHPRAQIDGARIVGRLMRQMDFGTAQEDGSVIVVFAQTDLRTAHMVARRLASVIRQTSNGKRDPRTDPVVTVAALLPSDSAETLLTRLYEQARRAAS